MREIVAGRQKVGGLAAVGHAQRPRIDARLDPPNGALASVGIPGGKRHTKRGRAAVGRDAALAKRGDVRVRSDLRGDHPQRDSVGARPHRHRAGRRDDEIRLPGRAGGGALEGQRPDREVIRSARRKRRGDGQHGEVRCHEYPGSPEREIGQRLKHGEGNVTSCLAFVRHRPCALPGPSP